MSVERSNHYSLLTILNLSEPAKGNHDTTSPETDPKENCGSSSAQTMDAEEPEETNMEVGEITSDILQLVGHWLPLSEPWLLPFLVGSLCPVQHPFRSSSSFVLAFR